MITHPRTEELVEAVARWIDSIRPDGAIRAAIQQSSRIENPTRRIKVRAVQTD